MSLVLKRGKEARGHSGLLKEESSIKILGGETMRHLAGFFNRARTKCGSQIQL